MTLLPIIFNLFLCLPFSGNGSRQNADPCEDAKAGAADATHAAKDSLFLDALAKIKAAYKMDGKEHAISFGKDSGGRIRSSLVSNGNKISGTVPRMPNAFADLHNHTNNIPPDAGDFYGLATLNKGNANYTTRFAVTTDETLFALLVTDPAALQIFVTRYPPQPPAFNGGPSGFPVAITDEAREMKYNRHCTDEMVLAFILEKYSTGICLLKQNNNGIFNRVVTVLKKNGSELLYTVSGCL